MRGEHAKTRRPRVILSRRVGNAQSPVAARSRQVGKTLFCRGGLKFIYKIQNLRYITMSPADSPRSEKGSAAKEGEWDGRKELHTFCSSHEIRKIFYLNRT